MKQKLLDAVLARGLAPNEKSALGLILAGKILVNDKPVTKQGALIDVAGELRVRGVAKFVSRSGLKLDGAIDLMQFKVLGRGFLDIGASTGGFTDALLQRGARFVAAIDVGQGLLHQRVAQNPRVQMIEGVDFKKIKVADLREPVEAFVADVSFASLEGMITHAFALTKNFSAQPEGLVLFKPQFELAKSERDMLEKGVLRDRDKSASLVAAFSERMKVLGIRVVAQTPAAIKGRRGNQEYLLHLSSLPSE